MSNFPKPIVLTEQEMLAIEHNRSLPKPGRSLLSHDALLHHIQLGNIIYTPGDSRDIKGASIDVRLGPWIYKHHREGGLNILNLSSERSVKDYWGEPQFAVLADDWMSKNCSLENVRPDNYLVLVHPKETVLAHTREFIGGQNCITTEMRARSGIGRGTGAVCKCAGWGDPGFFNRWTMEFSNMGDATIVLIVHMRVAQIAFYEIDPIMRHEGYSTDGKYQTSSDVSELMAKWQPSNMLPRIFADREIKEGFPPLDEIDLRLKEKLAA